MSNGYYYEVSFLGIWRPYASAQEPRAKTVNGVLRELRAQGTGRPIRNITKIPPEFEGFDLTLLQKWMSERG